MNDMNNQNNELEPENLEAFGKFKLLNPDRCERCDKPLDNCKGVVDPKMDGLHFWNGHFYCDACMQQFGKEEKEREEIK